jgi:aminoglycoside phosphotransferase family enzyme/predicted kinase
MDQEKFFESLKDPEVYGPDVNSIITLQTHISFIILTGKFAYKIKKPVNFGFLDFSTLEKRKHFCEEELRLNKRLCPDIYLDIVPINLENDKIKINGKGQIIDYAVKMREFSQKNIMINLLEKNKIDNDDIERISNILIDFYKKSDRSKEIDRYGSISLIKNNTDENFDQTKSVIDNTINKQIFDFIKNNTNDFLKLKKDYFPNRIKQGYIHDCHGDLHSGNIVINNEKVYIFDCIEFNKRFRYSDVASDIGFLAMDLDYLGHPYKSSFFIESYIEKSNDSDIKNILNFYKCYRAYVRGKVIGFKLEDPNIDIKEKQKIKITAKKYFDLAYYYSQLFSRNLNESKPVLFITSGLTGTGKTTVAKKISIDYNANMISTDSVRKELEGIDKFEKHHDAYNTGLYSPEKMLYTYNKILEKADKSLKKGNNVILDATFKTERLREMAKKIAEKNNAIFIILFCDCPERIVKKYLEKRIKTRTISDGRWEIYLKQKDSFESFINYDKIVKIDVSNQSFDYQISVFRDIINKINEG